jgi:hypothetical protein
MAELDKLAGGLFGGLMAILVMSHNFLECSL